MGPWVCGSRTRQNSEGSGWELGVLEAGQVELGKVMGQEAAPPPGPVWARGPS